LADCYDAIEKSYSLSFSEEGITTQMRFLIVDDTSRARQSMKALVEVWHPQVEIREATNGAEAVQMSEDFQPDVILMDARMPVTSGLEATRQIKARWPHIKIIILSVFMDYKALALEAGADGFVNKGDAPDELRRILLKIIQESL
jgi:two-component system nitrate/nitrite response regulator NarL